jgi:hypothetical protein
MSLTLGFSLRPLPPRQSHGRPQRPCPPRARSSGIWRSLTVNNGRSHTDLTCAIGVGSRLSGLPGRAFQARDRWGHIRATSGPRTTRSQRTTTVIIGPPSTQLSRHTPPPTAGRRDLSGLSDTEEVAPLRLHAKHNREDSIKSAPPRIGRADDFSKEDPWSAQAAVRGTILTWPCTRPP